MSISINKVEIACSVSHLESIVGGSGGRLVTLLATGLHSGVVGGLVQIPGDDNMRSDVTLDLRGLGVFGVLCCVT